jgi:hypothetical protein
MANAELAAWDAALAAMNATPTVDIVAIIRLVVDRAKGAVDLDSSCGP